MSGLAGALRCGDEAGAHPLAAGLSGSLGRDVDEGEFVIGEADVDGVAPRVVDWRSPHAFVGHDVRIAETKSIDQRNLCGYDKCMMTHTVRADEIRAGDYLTHGFSADRRARWSRVVSARVLKNGRVSVRVASGAWGASMIGTHQNIQRFAAEEMIEIAR